METGPPRAERVLTDYEELELDIERSAPDGSPERAIGYALLSLIDEVRALRTDLRMARGAEPV